jgi:hypothetical protein
MKVLRVANSTIPANPSLCNLGVLWVSVVGLSLDEFATETQSSQRLHRVLRLLRDTAIRLLLIAGFLIVAANFYSATVAQSGPPNISVNGSLSANKVKRGRTVQATVVMTIPSGYHVNSSRPLEKFLIATQLKAEAPREIRVSAVSYPRALLRKFQFSKNRVSVYEGRPAMRFSISVPNAVSTGSKEIKVRLRYQSCNDDACFPPQNKDVSLWLNVE